MPDSMTDSFNEAVAANANETLAARQEQVVTTTETTPANTETETTPAQTPAETTTTVTTPAYTPEWLKTEFETEDLNVVKERYKGYDTLKQELETLKSATPTVAPYKSELSKFIDNLPAGVDPKFAVQYFDVKPETLSAEEKWKLNEKFQKPYLTTEEINERFNNKFGFEEGIEPTDSEKVLKSAALKEEAHQAEIALKDYIGKTLNPVAPEVQRQESEAKLQKLSAEWGAKMPTLASTVKEVIRQVPVTMFGSDKPVLVDFKYQLPAEEQNVIAQEASKLALSLGLEPNEQTLKEVSEVATNLMWQRNGEKIAAAMVSEALSRQTEHFKQIMNNPNLAPVSQNMTSGSKYTPAEQSIVNAMKRGL